MVICCLCQACGSGGTSAGLSLGAFLSGMMTTVHAYAVCDDADYFHEYMDGLFEGLGATPDVIGSRSRDMVRVAEAKGAGYAMSREEELETIKV